MAPTHFNNSHIYLSVEPGIEGTFHLLLVLLIQTILLFSSAGSFLSEQVPETPSEPSFSISGLSMDASRHPPTSPSQQLSYGINDAILDSQRPVLYYKVLPTSHHLGRADIVMSQELPARTQLGWQQRAFDSLVYVIWEEEAILAYNPRFWQYMLSLQLDVCASIVVLL